MGIGPSTKETSLHHFRDPLLEVVAEDTDLDLRMEMKIRCLLEQEQLCGQNVCVQTA